MVHHLWWCSEWQQSNLPQPKYLTKLEKWWGFSKYFLIKNKLMRSSCANSARPIGPRAYGPTWILTLGNSWAFPNEPSSFSQNFDNFYDVTNVYRTYIILQVSKFSSLSLLMSAPHSQYLYHLIHYFITLERVLDYFYVCFDVLMQVDEIEENKQKLTNLEKMAKL